MNKNNDFKTHGQNILNRSIATAMTYERQSHMELFNQSELVARIIEYNAPQYRVAYKRMLCHFVLKAGLAYVEGVIHEALQGFKAKEIRKPAAWVRQVLNYGHWEVTSK